MDRNTVYKLSKFGEEYVEAMPDKKAMADVKRKYAKLKRKQEHPHRIDEWI